jgi:simple sugar transport system ATP-binding protein
MTPIIEVIKGTKKFSSVPAIQDVDFSLRTGEIHGLVGENGAGKSTLTKVMAGVYQLTEGVLKLDGNPVVFNTPSEGLQNGVAMVFQETSLVPSMTVAQNLYLGEEKFFNRLRPLYIAAQQFLQSMNFDVDPWAKVAGLGAAQMQIVEIARAVRLKARVIIFDEPTATLTPEEKYHFFALVKRLKEYGTSTIFISHALEEALDIADRITVMRDGLIVATDKASNFNRDRLVSAMVGRSLSDQLYSGHKTGSARGFGRKVLSVQGLSMGARVHNNSFSIYEGQITGIFGLVGSGRTETMKVVAGVEKRRAFNGGQVVLDGRFVRYRVPRPAVRDGIVYVTEDRKQEGFFETMAFDKNIYVNNLAADFSGKTQIIRAGKMRQLEDYWRNRLSIRSTDNKARVLELSGGNQQKVVVGGALVKRPKVIIFDEPTRGVDVGAIAEIHQIIQGLADEGIAVVIISSYLPEILNLSDRILVCRSGRIVEEFSPKEATEEKIMYAAVH